MRLSDLPRRLGRVSPWLWLAWPAAAVALAPVVGGLLRGARRLAEGPQRVPQIDAPLWRGTDLADDGLPDWTDPSLEGSSTSLSGAILALGYATTEADARYWLAMCARRGATWQQQRELWDEWQRLSRGSVHYLHADREDDRP